MSFLLLLASAFASDAVALAGSTPTRAPSVLVDLHGYTTAGATTNSSTVVSPRDPAAPIVRVVPTNTSMELVLGVADGTRTVSTVTLLDGRTSTQVYSRTLRAWNTTLPSGPLSDGYLDLLVTYTDGSTMHLGVDLTTSTGRIDPASGRALNPQPEPPGYGASFAIRFDVAASTVPTVQAQLDASIGTSIVSFSY